MNQRPGRPSALITFVGLLMMCGACASSTGPQDGGDAAVSPGARCHGDFHHAATAACTGVYPAGQPCTARCTFCMPQRGSGGECVCDGAMWVCPGDFSPPDAGCTSSQVYHTAAVPSDCM